MTEVNRMETDGDFVLLESNEAYGKYFAMLMRAFEVLISWYRQGEGGDDEELIVADFMERILYSLKLLALRSCHASQPALRLDLKESGYPHALAIMGLEADLGNKAQTLLEQDTQPIIKDAIITHLATSDDEPKELLEAMSVRQYYERLDAEKMMMIFTPGKLVYKGENETARQYLYSWLYFDKSSSVPYVYILAFDQDITATSLELSDPAREEFFKAVRQTGTSMAQLQTIAKSIDEAIESVHPKILKRIKLGSVLTVKYSREEHPLLKVLREHGGEEDFIFHFRDEMVFSKRQVEVERKGFFGSRQVRQVFAVPQDDIDCAKAGVSRIRRTMLMPHYLAQHLDRGDPQITRYNSIATYTKGGHVNAI